MTTAATPASRAASKSVTPRSPPSFFPRTLAAARAALVRAEIMPASSSATAAIAGRGRLRWRVPNQSSPIGRRPKAPSTDQVMTRWQQRLRQTFQGQRSVAEPGHLSSSSSIAAASATLSGALSASHCEAFRSDHCRAGLDGWPVSHTDNTGRVRPRSARTRDSGGSTVSIRRRRA
jgi:hypothetical protein